MSMFDIHVNDVVTIGKGRTRWVVVHVGTTYCQLEKETDSTLRYYGIATRRLTKQPRDRVENDPHTTTLENLKGY